MICVVCLFYVVLSGLIDCLCLFFSCFDVFDIVCGCRCVLVAVIVCCCLCVLLFTFLCLFGIC